jgi:hypothetical protein
MINASVVIRNFRNSSAKNGFPHLNKRLLVEQITTRVNDPSRISQGGSSLCGAASFLFCLAKKDPGTYAKYIVDLYETGKGKIGNMTTKPGRSCRNYRLPTKSRMSDADWIGLASLRDSANLVMDYEDYSDQAAGITAPETVEDWFRDGGFRQVTNRCSIIKPRSLYDLLQAHKKYRAGANVCLLISSGGLRNPGKLVPHVDHWIVLDSPVRIDANPVAGLLARGREVNKDKELLGKSIEFKVYTWGEQGRSINTWRRAPLKVSDFLDNFYGVVSAK